MPDYFWEWYKNKGYDKTLSIEGCFNNKAFLIGCCTEYLIEKGQRLTKMHEYSNMNDILAYLQAGVAWTR
ncbi:hypothetical protein [Desulfosporosinus sp. BICA1-9]|uniref:hypothetical protein n=1 Tax=Desulfosporosinus sp. BICA1-9 TaxID=1531958 RepID=UPI00054B9FA1|nr:hypothetical protein [Desulfosporosinus sp. BICA1-9]KJS47531.1 MAG: hypothetical protein VR66_19195 [Peptococcaceae bacterium BRH_c23]KJS87169.1 MAG: hypothetical protein JL57_14730 [Desulfosporosinus sp. BICA1-9]HBW38798.1 hypothetical protein [Desulfosporosinus sp.]